MYALQKPLFVCPSSGSRSTAGDTLGKPWFTANSHGYGCGLSLVVCITHHGNPLPTRSTMRFKGMAESARGHNFSLSLFSLTTLSVQPQPMGKKSLLFFFLWPKKTTVLQKLTFFWPRKKKSKVMKKKSKVML